MSIANPATQVDSYDPSTIEAYWSKKWEDDGLYRAKVDWDKPKHYALTMLPYPSWRPAHRSLVRHDAFRCALARYMRMKGYNVMFPDGL